MHDMFRREFALAPAAVAKVDAGDLSRAAAVAEHVRLLCRLLRAHDDCEERLLMPKLLARAGTSAIPLLTAMRQQHEQLDVGLSHVSAALEAWRPSASSYDRAALASALARLVPHLYDHMESEEWQILPIAGRHLAANEWYELFWATMRSVPRRSLPTALGMALYEADPEVRFIITHRSPLVLRPALSGLADRAYARSARRIHGTATPSRFSEGS